MKGILTIVICFFAFWMPSQAQCEQVNSEGLELVLDLLPKAKMQGQIQVSLKNNATVSRSFCWFDLEQTWGLPLAFNLTVIDENGKIILDKFNWAKQFSPQAYSNYKKKSDLITIDPDKIYSKEIVLYWPNQLPGVYKVQLTTASQPEIISNQITLEIK